LLNILGLPSLFCDQANYTRLIEDETHKENIDACCRVLDKCAEQDHILPHRSKHGLPNIMMHIATPCDCNAKFVNCLKDTNTRSSRRIYSNYISVVPKCFKMEKPIDKCEQYDTDLSCVKYQLKDGVIRHQFFDQYKTNNDDDIGVLRKQENNSQPNFEDTMLQDINRIDQPMGPLQNQFLDRNHHMFQTAPPQPHHYNVDCI
jgi:hypothetical protein